MEQTFFALASLMAGLAVALGAFGAHALKSRLTADRRETFETGVRYQMYHALGILAAALAAGQWAASSWASAAAWLFVTGILLFSGSLYLLVFSGRRWLGAITPLGGIAFIAGWVCLAAAAVLR